MFKKIYGIVAKGWFVYLMLLGSSQPYPWLILEENGHWDDEYTYARILELLNDFILLFDC